VICVPSGTRLLTAARLSRASRASQQHPFGTERDGMRSLIRRASVAAGAAVMLLGPAAGVASAGTVAVATSERERQS